MITKCFNPECQAAFDYREGRLVRSSRMLSNSASNENRPVIEHFWLCASCTAAYTLEIDSEMKVGIRPRSTELTERKLLHSVTAA